MAVLAERVRSCLFGKRVHAVYNRIAYLQLLAIQAICGFNKLLKTEDDGKFESLSLRHVILFIIN